MQSSAILRIPSWGTPTSRSLGSPEFLSVEIQRAWDAPALDLIDCLLGAGAAGAAAATGADGGGAMVDPCTGTWAPL